MAPPLCRTQCALITARVDAVPGNGIELAMDYAAARRRMVENQLRTNQIVDQRVIAAMGRIPRELFVPESLKGIAYVDEDLSLGRGRYLMEPLVMARLLQAATIEPEDAVLDVGCTTGYSAAVMSQLASTVVALESDQALAAEAERLSSELELDNVAVVQGPLKEGYKRGGPYNVIIFSGAVTEFPGSIIDQLAEGGRMVAVISPRAKVGTVTLIRRIHGDIARTPGYDAFTPFLPDFEPVERFTF